MSSTQHPAVTLANISFAWPDGSLVVRDLTASFNSGRTGLVGANGTGKTTLLRLIAGELAAGSGSITTDGQVGYLPQRLTLRTDATVAGLLGVHDRLAALRAIESGDAHSRHFEALSDDWDVEARSLATLDRIGLSGVGLDRRIGSLSGGETMLAALAGLQVAGDEIVLLDEPTNSLDRFARHRFYDAITSWRGALIVVSHDVRLLNLMDDTAELRTGSLTVFGGPYDDYRDRLAAEQDAAEQALRTAEQQLRTERRQRVEAQTKLARRQRYARTDFENKRKPKIIMNNRKQEAQVSAGKLRGELDAKVEAAQAVVDAQAARVRRDVRIAIDLPDPGVPVGRRLAELRDGRGRGLVLQGPERVALTGRNGVGKTRLLEQLVGPGTIGHGAVGHGGVRAVRHTDRIGYLPQRLDQLDDDSTILDAVRASAPGVPPARLRAGLARFLFRGDVIHRRVGDLSGGERFRVALARLLLADPPTQLLVLDEPTNNLDLHSVDELVDALEAYRGGLVVVSHDDAFLSQLDIDTWLTLDADGLSRGEPTPGEQYWG